MLTLMKSDSSSASLLSSFPTLISGFRSWDFFLPWPLLRFPFGLGGFVANLSIRGVERQSRKSSKLAVSSAFIIGLGFGG